MVRRIVALTVAALLVSLGARAQEPEEGQSGLRSALTDAGKALAVSRGCPVTLAKDIDLGVPGGSTRFEVRTCREVLPGRDVEDGPSEFLFVKNPRRKGIYLALDVFNVGQRVEKILPVRLGAAAAPAVLLVVYQGGSGHYLGFGVVTRDASGTPALLPLPDIDALLASSGQVRSTEQVGCSGWRIELADTEVLLKRPVVVRKRECKQPAAYVTGKLRLDRFALTFTDLQRTPR